MHDLENPMVIGDYYDDDCQFYGNCDSCGRFISAGDTIVRIDNMLFCEECVNRGKEVAGND